MMAVYSEGTADIDKIEVSIQGIKQQIDQYEEILKSAESGHASVPYLNEKYHAIILAAKDISQHLKELRATTNAVGVSEEVRSRARLLLEQAINQTTRVQKIGRETQRISTSLARSASIASQAQGYNLVDLEGGNAGEFQTQQQQQQQQQQQIVASQEQEEQMAREMEALEADIVTVNELFTTLATYVHDQGEIVDSIEANTEAAYVQVQTGVQQLQTAVQHRKSARRKKCVCAAIILVALIIIALIIGLSLKKS